MWGGLLAVFVAKKGYKIEEPPAEDSHGDEDVVELLDPAAHPLPGHPHLYHLLLLLVDGPLELDVFDPLPLQVLDQGPVLAILTPVYLLHQVPLPVFPPDGGDGDGGEGDDDDEGGGGVHL